MRPIQRFIALLALILTGHAHAQGTPQGAATPLATATFAAGCFWCAEADFEKVQGVVDVVSGYMGGRTANPTYEQVSAGGTGHREVVQVRYDPTRVSYARLLDVFWRNVDPFDAAGQFCDKGMHYTGAIYVADEEQRRQATASRAALAPRSRLGPVVTQIVSAAPFYEAEAYHQAYYKKNPIRYRFYRSRCGRDARLAEVWGDKGSR
jgi:peptide-methionine (S)-S-oxide reductase